MAWAEPERLKNTTADWYASFREALARPLTSYYMLLSASVLLVVIGLIMVASASSVFSYRASGDSYGIVKRQLMWVAIALPLAFLASRMPLRWIRRLSWVALGGSIILLGLVQVPGLGVEVNGNTNWLALGPIRVQPSELAKLSLVLWMADVYARKERRLTQMQHLLIPVVPVLLLVIGLVLVGRDLGTALVLFAIGMAMLWVVGFPWRWFALSGVGLGAVALVLAWSSPERMQRLTNFVDPLKDYLDTGWQPAHGLYALATGRWFGQGIGDSTQKWGDLPEAHTDFIFAVLGEELGLVGTLLVVGLFLVISFAAIRVAMGTSKPFVRYASFGIVAWLVGQMIINVGMVLALLPVIGIPLPLISYGGSALVPSMIALGLLIGFARREPEAAAALAARRHGSGVWTRTAPVSTTGASTPSSDVPVGARRSTPSTLDS